MECVGCLPVVTPPTAAQRLGVTPHRVRRLLADGVLVRVARGAVAGVCVVERARSDRRLAHELRLRALLLTYDDCVASHESAALLHALPTLDIPGVVTVTRPSGAWRGGSGSRVRIAPLPPHHRAAVGGVGATSLPRTVVDVARTASLRESVVLGDAALRQGCDRELLLATVEECAAWSDVGKARRAVAFYDGRSESPLESVSRALMHIHDVPAPEVQHVVEIDRWTSYRVDFYWKGARLIGEADGLEKYDDPAALRAEKIRQERLEQAGFQVVRWTFRDMVVNTAETVDRIMRRLRCR